MWFDSWKYPLSKLVLLPLENFTPRCAFYISTKILVNEERVNVGVDGLCFIVRRFLLLLFSDVVQFIFSISMCIGQQRHRGRFPKRLSKQKCK